MGRRSRRKALDAAEELVEHIIANQIEPQLRVEELRSQGIDVSTAMVSTRADDDGYEVACHFCERKARLPFQPPPGKALMCPDCMRARR